ESIADGFGKSDWPRRPRADNRDAVKLHTLQRFLPRFSKKMRLVPALDQRTEQPLQIQLRPACGGKLATEEGELHRCVIFLSVGGQGNPIQAAGLRQTELFPGGAWV